MREQEFGDEERDVQEDASSKASDIQELSSKESSCPTTQNHLKRKYSFETNNDSEYSSPQKKSKIEGANSLAHDDLKGEASSKSSKIADDDADDGEHDQPFVDIQEAPEEIVPNSEDEEGGKDEQHTGALIDQQEARNEKDEEKMQPKKSSKREKSSPRIRHRQKRKVQQESSSSSSPEHESSDNRSNDEQLPFPDKVYEPKSKKLFGGFSFLLTSFGEKPSNIFQTLEDRPSEAEEEIDLSELVALIKKNGGKIIEKLSPEAGTTKRKWIYPGIPSLLCLSPCPTISEKFISALAYSVPPIHYGWISECIQQNQITSLNDYLLPSGRDLNGEHLFMRQISVSERNIFEGARIEVSGNSTFQALWERIAKATGAKCVRRLFSANESSIDYVLTHLPLTDSVVKRAEILNIPVVNKQWMLHCLFTGKKVPLATNESFYFFLHESTKKTKKRMSQE